MKPTIKFLLSLSIGAAAALGCKSAPQTQEAPQTKEWSYEGSTGPEHWAELSPDNALAKTGRSQSPIDIRKANAQPGVSDPLEVTYAEIPLEILNNGHTVEVMYQPGSSLVVDGNTFQLQQFHFHSPSEHTVDGKHSALEVHLVHKDAGGKLAVLGVLVDEGNENKFLEEIWPHLPRKKGDTAKVPDVRIDCDELLPDNMASYRYSGSLTTPPCSEQVQWFVLQHEVEASPEQLREFREVISGNNRPTQPLNGRRVVASP